MKRIFSVILALVAVLPLRAQLYHPGEVLQYRVSYRAKMFPNTEAGSVEVKTSETERDGRKYYLVEAEGRTLPTYRWFYNLKDTYKVWVDPATLRTEYFESDLHESDYTFQSYFDYDWDNGVVDTRWRRRQNPYSQKRMAITPESMDAISLFFNMRTAEAGDFSEGRPELLRMVLQDTIRNIRYRFLGREVKKIRNVGKFRTLKFDCQLGTSEGYSFTDGTIFTIWISDDDNKIPLYIESPVRVGSINGYISGYKNLKYPLTSLIK